MPELSNVAHSEAERGPASAVSFHQKLLDSLYDGVYFVDTERRITYWNKGAEHLTGYQAQEAAGRHCFDNFLMHADKAGCALCLERCPLGQTLADGECREAEVFLRHKQGHRLPVRIRVSPIMAEDGSIVGAVEIFTDISAMKKLERIAGDLQDLAYFDELTRVANRRYIELKIQQAIEEVEQFHRAYGIVLIDIDHFKIVNDQYGHQAGDQVLKKLCEVLGHCLRPGDLIGRWGGDEFVVVAKDVTHPSLERLAERSRHLIRETPLLVTSDGPLHLSVSLGATLLGAGDVCHVALDRADRLMYASKGAGKNRVRIG